MEERRGHLNRIEARGAGDLGEHEDDADALADMLQRDGEGVDDGEVGKRRQRRGEDERRRRDGLHAEREHPDTADDRLHHGDGRKEQIPTPVALGQRQAGDALAVRLLAHDDEQHEGADPEREVHEQRCHGAAVGVQRIELLGDHLGGRRHERRDLVGVKTALAHEPGKRVGGAEGEHVVVDDAQLAFQAGVEPVGLGHR